MVDRWVELFASWLRTRTAKVAVNGQFSQELLLENMVFQGTVWGLILWNVFYEDAVLAVQKSGFTEVVFADDLNAFLEVEPRQQNERALEKGKACQQQLHKWGPANQVTFDSSKESLHVLSAK